jgi:hypothetical protein
MRSGDADRFETGRVRPKRAGARPSRAILGQLAAAYTGEGGFRQLPGTAQSFENGVKYDEYQGFSGVLQDIDRSLAATDQPNDGGH